MQPASAPVTIPVSIESFCINAEIAGFLSGLVKWGSLKDGERLAAERLLERYEAAKVKERNRA